VGASSQARAFVPLGNLLEPHHGDCYRLFNMSQELRAQIQVQRRERGTVGQTRRGRASVVRARQLELLPQGAQLCNDAGRCS